MHHDHIVGVIFSDKPQLHDLAAQFDGHLPTERNIGYSRGPFLAHDDLFCPFVRHHNSAIFGENFTARDVIPVIVAVDDIADGLIKPLGDFVLQPDARIGIDGIGDDDAFRGDQKYRIMEIVLKAIKITADLGNRPLWCRLGKSRTAGNEQYGEG